MNPTLSAGDLNIRLDLLSSPKHASYSCLSTTSAVEYITTFENHSATSVVDNFVTNLSVCPIEFLESGDPLKANTCYIFQ